MFVSLKPVRMPCGVWWAQGPTDWGGLGPGRWDRKDTSEGDQVLWAGRCSGLQSPREEVEGADAQGGDLNVRG